MKNQSIELSLVGQTGDFPDKLFISDITCFRLRWKMALCPYCEKEVNLANIIREEELKPMKRKEIIYSCPHCNKIITISASFN